ncbi:MAG: response regulator transcription factor [Vampirovibrionales bacterium]|nr:response regulator transcription factor [Vampirovibrionales bacterium]
MMQMALKTGLVSVDVTDKKPVGVIITDDHAVVRQGTRGLLEADPALRVLGEAASVAELEILLEEYSPDCVLLDINMPGVSGIQALDALTRLYPKIWFIAFSAYNEPQYTFKALERGAKGFISKTQEGAHLRALIKLVGDPTKVPILSDDVQELYYSARRQIENQPKLTTREVEILSMVASGQTNKAIAESLIVSVKTVDTHVGSMMKKLNVNNRTQLSSFAREYGLF